MDKAAIEQARRNMIGHAVQIYDDNLTNPRSPRAATISGLSEQGGSVFHLTVHPCPYEDVRLNGALPVETRLNVLVLGPFADVPQGISRYGRVLNGTESQYYWSSLLSEMGQAPQDDPLEPEEGEEHEYEEEEIEEEVEEDEEEEEEAPEPEPVAPPAKPRRQKAPVSKKKPTTKKKTTKKKTTKKAPPPRTPKSDAERRVTKKKAGTGKKKKGGSAERRTRCQ